MRLFNRNTDPYEKYRGQDYYFIDRSQNLYFKSFRSGEYELIENVDLNSLVFLTDCYFHDKDRVYHESKCLKEGYTSFKDFESYGYFKVDETLYWYGKKVKDNFSGDLFNISEHFFTDNDTLFVNGHAFDFDLNSFSVLNKSYAKDASVVFYSDEIIDSADSKTFSVIRTDSGYSQQFLVKHPFLADNGSSPWARDKNNLYYCGQPFLVGVIDPLTSRVIRSHILIDKDNVLYHEKIVKDADPNTFECVVKNSVKPGEMDDSINRIKFFTRFFKDKANIFYLYEDDASESSAEIIRCSPNNRDQYIDDLTRLAERHSIYTLDPRDVERIKSLVTDNFGR